MGNKPKTTADRQRALRERRTKAGHVRKEYWANEAEHIKLKETLKYLREKACVTGNGGL